MRLEDLSGVMIRSVSFESVIFPGGERRVLLVALEDDAESVVAFLPLGDTVFGPVDVSRVYRSDVEVPGEGAS